MSETYTKLFQTILRSSIWLEPDHVRVVWVTMLALADQHGYVGASVGGLASQARVTKEQCEEALGKFLSADTDSRSKEYDGCRIEVADRGWNLLNYQRFRDMRDEDARKAYERDRKRSQRAANKSRTVTESPGQVPHVPRSPELSAQSRSISEADRNQKEDLERHDAAGELVFQPAPMPQKRVAKAPPKPKVVRWRRVPEDWNPKADHQTIAAQMGISLTLEAQKYRDHEFATPKTDPDATFRNWLRNAKPAVKPVRNGFQPPGPRTKLLADGSEAELYESR